MNSYGAGIPELMQMDVLGSRLPPAPRAPDVDEADLQRVYSWVDMTPFSRPKRQITKDFSDGVLFAEMLHYSLPHIVEPHNYATANSHKQKLYNWNTINVKVLRKLGYGIHKDDLEDIITSKSGAIERVLRVLQDKLIMIEDGRIKVDSIREPSPHASHYSSQTLSSSRRSVAEEDKIGILDKSIPGREDIVKLEEIASIQAEKIKKLQELVSVKDAKIDTLCEKLMKYGLHTDSERSGVFTSPLSLSRASLLENSSFQAPLSLPIRRHDGRV